MSIREAVADIRMYIDFELDMLSEHPPVQDIEERCDNLTKYFRISAVGAILLGSDSEAFYHQLTGSGQVRRYFLERCGEQPEFKSAYRATGNSRAFLDVVAARQLTLAREIVSFSSPVWWEGEEYEEDFYYAHLLHLLVEEERPVLQLVETVDRLEEALEGDHPGRLLVCRSLVEEDEGAFGEGFAGLLEARELELEEMSDGFWPNDRIEHRAESQVFVEGLALLNLADLAGLKTEAEYRFCPLATRLPMTEPPPTNGLIPAPLNQ